MLKRYIDTFEVHLCRRGLWSVEHAGLTAPQARELGEAEFRRAGVSGFRIVRVRLSRVTGAASEDLMMERIRPPPAADAQLGPVEEAPPCRVIDDLLRPASRLALHRLFQGWLRSHEAGVTECLVSPKLLRLLLDNSALMNSAMHHVATLQAAGAEDAAEARRRLAVLADAVQDRARDAEAWIIRRVRGDPALLLKTLQAPGEDADQWRACAAVAAYLTPCPSRLAKVEALIALAGGDHEPRILQLLDMFLADYLMDEDTTLELAGRLPFTSDRLQWIADAATGTAPKPVRAGGPAARHGFAADLPRLLAGGRLPRSGFALLQALDAVLRRDAPLNDGSAGREQGAVLALIQRLGAGAGFAGGPRVAARLARRFASASPGDTEDSFLDAVDTIVLGLADVHVQVRFLLALLSGPHPERTQAGLRTITHRAFTLYGGLKRLVRRAASIEEAVSELDSLCMLIDQSYVDRETRDTWSHTVLGFLDDTVGARIANGEMTMQQLLGLAESGRIASKAVRQALVRRLSRAAGIVS